MDDQVAKLNEYHRHFQTVRDFARQVGSEECSHLYTVVTESQLEAITSAGSLNYSENLKFWLSPTLFQGRLPDKSPFGTRMIVFDTDYILSLFGDPTLGFLEARYFEQKGTQYIRLALDLSEVIEGLTLLNLNENPIFRKDRIGQFRVVKNYIPDVAKVIVHIRVCHPIPLVKGKFWIKEVDIIPVTPGGYEGRLGTLSEIQRRCPQPDCVIL